MDDSYSEGTLRLRFREKRSGSVFIRSDISGTSQFEKAIWEGNCVTRLALRTGLRSHIIDVSFIR